MFTFAPINPLQSNPKDLAEEAVLLQVEEVFTKPDPYRASLLELADAHASFQFDENINHAAAGEYVLSIYRRTRGLDVSDAKSGDDIESLFMNLLHAARFRGLDAKKILRTASGIFAEEVRDEKKEIGDVLKGRR
jgi:hypothetical protein